MKTPLKFSYLLLSGLAIIWLASGCKPGDNQTTPQSSCRIQQYTSVSASRFLNDNLQTTYSYDSQGNLLKTASVYEKKPISGADGAQTRTTTDTYVYNTDGFLTTSTENTLTTTVFAGKTTQEQFTRVSSFSYTNGRLTAKSSLYTVTPYSSSNSPAITTYEYDAGGDLTKMTTGNAVWIYQNNQLIDYVEKSGTTEIRPYTIQKGVFTKMVFPGTTDESITTAMFDTQQRLIRREEYLNGQLNRYDLQTWSDAKPSSATLPLFKGFPVTVPASPFTGPDGVLATHKQYYWNAISKTMQPFTEDVYTVQTNSQGLVSATTVTAKHPLAADQDYTTTETYTYTGCQ